MFRLPPIPFMTATAAGATQAKTLFPNATYTATLPSIGSGGQADIVNASAVKVGGIIAPAYNWSAVLLDILTTGGADVTGVIEIGKLNASGGMCVPLASCSIKSITTAGTIADANPYTGTATVGTTWRLIDLDTITGTGAWDQVSLNVQGTENDQPSQLMLTTDEACWYYVMLTTLSSFTAVNVYCTPYSGNIVRTKAGP